MHREDGKSADDLYENIVIRNGQPGKVITDRNASRIPSSELTESDEVKISSRAAVVCLLLLCVLLVTAVIVMGVTFTQERHQLLANITNLIQLNRQFNQEKNKLSKFIQDGWIYYQFSLYYVSSEMKNWTGSRRYCTERGTDLVIINNRDEQELVKRISNGSEVWIGLTDSNEEESWKWVDGSTLNSSSGFWRSGEPDGGISDNCTISRSTEWSIYPCFNNFNWICEMKNIK